MSDELKPDDVLTIMVNDFETKYVSRASYDELRADNRRMAIANETMDVALHQIIRWCDSYPTDVFGEPDIDQARKLLEAGGMTLASISAFAVRRIVSAIRGYAQAAIFTINEAAHDAGKDGGE